MDLTKMHVMFRQFAQQMGMQNVRAILPEQIDLLLNTSISDTVNQIIRDNVNMTNDRVITDNSKIGQVNALRTLYTVAEIFLVGVKTLDENNEVTVYGGETLGRSRRYIDKFTATFDKLIPGTSNPVNGTSYPIKKAISNDLLSLVDFSISYAIVVGKGGDNYSPEGVELTLVKNTPQSFNTSFETNFFPVRLIDDIYLADVLNDFVLAPVLRSPVATVHDNSVDLYFGKIKNDVLDNGLIPYQLRVGYIRKPAVVKYSEDISIPNIDCDLPEGLHTDIVKHAVELWQMAVNNSLATEQNRLRRAQQEQIRNNNRNEND